jgi:hypothetical protein
MRQLNPRIEADAAMRRDHDEWALSEIGGGDDLLGPTTARLV